MDETDLRIFRALTRDRVFFWASLDPRVSAEKVARRLRLAPRTVRDRIRAWRDSGFLVRTDVLPHPELLGMRLGSGNVRIDDVRAKPGAIEDLQLVPGVLALLDHVGPWLAFSVLAESDAGLDRVRRLAARLDGVDEVTPCRPLAPPPPAKALRRLDWEILRELRATPDAPLREIAARLRIGLKTMSRRYEALVEGNAVLFVPVVDLRRLDGVPARFIVLPQPDADRAKVLAHLRELPLIMDPFDARHLGAVSHPPLDAWARLPSLAEAEDVQRALLDAPGVAEVEVVFPTRQVFFTRWLGEAIDARLAAAAG